MGTKIKEILNLESRLQAVEITPTTLTPAASLDLAGHVLPTMTLNTNLAVTTLTNVPTIGISIRVIPSTYTFSFLGKSDFKPNSNGEYIVKIINYGTLASPIIRVHDGVSSGVTTLAELDTSVTGTQLDDIKVKTDRILTPLSPVWESTDILAGNTTPLTLVAAPGAGIAYFLTDKPLVYVEFKGAYSTYTTLNLKIGSTIVGTCDCLGATASGWYEFTLNGNATEINGAITVEVNGGDPTGGTSHLGFYINYKSVDLAQYTFPTSEVMYDDFTGVNDDPPNPAKWTKQITTTTRLDIVIDTNQCKFESIGSGTSTAELDYIISQASSNGIAFLGFDMITDDAPDSLVLRCDIWGGDSNNRVSCYTISGGNMGFILRENGINHNFFNSGVAGAGSTWGISIDASNNIRYWRKIGGTWTELDSGIAKQYSIGTTKYARFSIWKKADAAVGAKVVIDNFTFDNEILG